MAKTVEPAKIVKKKNFLRRIGSAYNWLFGRFNILIWYGAVLLRGAMAWDSVQIHAENGRPVRKEDREAILAAVDKAVLRSDRDPDVILKAAADVGRRVERVKSNLHAYASRCIFRAVRKAEVAELKRDELASPKELAHISDSYLNAEQVESRILVRELIETLAPQDREIVLRHMFGNSFPQIDRDMSLKPRTAEFRFRFCKDALQSHLCQKLPR